MATFEILEKFVRTEIAVGLGKKSLDPDEDLIEKGIIDSLGILKVVLFIEKTFGIEIVDEDVVPENFRSVNTMVKFVEQKIRNK
jgi:acyl carrier protein